MANERNTLTDDELIADFVRGDALAFEELVLRYKNSLYQYILVMTGDEGAAGDLFQEVFLSVSKTHKNTRPRVNLRRGCLGWGATGY